MVIGPETSLSLRPLLGYTAGYLDYLLEKPLQRRVAKLYE